jgi:hypothetical protein
MDYKSISDYFGITKSRRADLRQHFIIFAGLPDRSPPNVIKNFAK